jgi:NAD(P)-dependent dehydrogenase (short-subunit alcohol dehydrogenase family)
MGLATGQRLALEGAQGVIASRSEKKLKAALSGIESTAEAKSFDFTEDGFMLHLVGIAGNVAFYIKDLRS